MHTGRTLRYIKQILFLRKEKREKALFVSGGAQDPEGHLCVDPASPENTASEGDKEQDSCRC